MLSSINRLDSTHLALALALVGVATSFAAERQPNIMLVIADDMTWSDCQPYGNQEVKTVNLARLAAEGMKFNACFTATAMCAPTRQQLYTGIFPVRNGAYPNHSRVYDGTQSIAHHLKSHAYRVGLIGKRHIKPAASYPFEYLGTSKKGASDVQAIAQFVNREVKQPYCLIVASNEPHTPWNQGPQHAYEPAKLTVPTYLEDTPQTRAALSKYFAEITFLDGQLGDCMKVVDQSGSRDNTIVMFTSEQGSSFPFGGKWTCYDTGLKTALIVRWPDRIAAGSETDAMVQYVDILPTLLEAAGEDPTAIETGRPGARDGGSGMDGLSFLKVLLGQANSHRHFAYGVHTTRGINNGSESYPIRSVRSTRFKYIRNLNWQSTFTNAVTREGKSGVLTSWQQAGGPKAARAAAYQQRPAEELYDLMSDPWELNNVADHPALAETKEALRKQLHDWMKQQGDLGEATEMKAKSRQGRAEDAGKKKKKKSRGE